MESEGFWAFHMDFHRPAHGAPALVGAGRAGEILVNVLLPHLYASAHLTGNPELGRRALELYCSAPPCPDNEVTREVKALMAASKGGCPVVNSARRQQGLIHVYRVLQGRGRAGGRPQAARQEWTIHRDDHLPLSSNEAVEASFGDRRGLDPAASGDRKSIVLTDRRLLLVHRNGRSRDVTFASLLDVGLVEVRRSSRGLMPLWRVALLLAGSGAALATIGYPPLEIGLAAVLALAALYHLYHYLDVAEEGTILFHLGQLRVELQYEGRLAAQAYDFADRVFSRKEALLPARAAAQEAPDETWEEPGEWESEWRW